MSTPAEELQMTWQRWKRHTDRGNEWEARRTCEQILTQLEPLVHKLVNRMLIPSDMSADELHAAGRYGVYQAIKRYELDKGTVFLSFAYATVWGYLLHALRNNRRSNPHSAELDENSASIEWEDTTDKRLALSSALAGLCPCEQELLQWRFVEQETLRDIGARLGVTGTAAQNRIKCVLVKLSQDPALTEITGLL